MYFPTGPAESFLIAFPALLSIVNPIAGALIFSQVTASRGHDERTRLALLVGSYSAVVMVLSLWLGAYVLSFFGVTLGALRIGGGLVVAVRAWELLATPETHQARKQEQANPEELGEDAAFFPLTIPFTTGPGTISVAIALGSNRPATEIGLLPFMLGATLAALAVALSIWVAYRSSDALVRILGPARAKVFTRLAAFLLLCIGTQILINGVDDVLDTLLGRYFPAR